MLEESANSEAGQAQSEAAGAPAASTAAEEVVPRRADRHQKSKKGRRGKDSSPPDTPKERRRRRMRRAANLMIIAGVLGVIGIVLYFVVTNAITAREQERLGIEYSEDNPELASAEAGVSEEGFLSLGEWADDAMSAALEEYQAKLDELAYAANYYQGQVVRREGQPIGKIVIPKIDLGVTEELLVVEGVLGGRIDALLRNGPAHWPETKMPGAGGMVVISGHRTTYGMHFRHLDKLEPGDAIELWMPYGVIRYEVTEVFIVGDEEVQAVMDRGKEQISLVACHPLSSSTQRIIAQGDMASFYLYETEE